MTLRTQNLSVRFGGVEAISDVSLQVPTARIHGIIGPNGAGKTSLVNAICGVVRPASGKVWLDDRLLTGLSSDRIARAGIRRTFQTSRMFAGMTALENVMCGLHNDIGTSFVECLLTHRRVARAERAAMERAAEMLDFVGMGAFASHQAADLSFGQQRLVEIARALVSSPAVLLLDEPAVGLNINRIDALDALLRRISRERGVTVIMVEHVLRLVMNVCERISVLAAGRVIAEGSPDDILGNERVAEVYLGKAAHA